MGPRCGAPCVCFTNHAAPDLANAIALRLLDAAVVPVPADALAERQECDSRRQLWAVHAKESVLLIDADVCASVCGAKCICMSCVLRRIDFVTVDKVCLVPNGLMWQYTRCPNHIMQLPSDKAAIRH